VSDDLPHADEPNTPRFPIETWSVEMPFDFDFMNRAAVATHSDRGDPARESRAGSRTRFDPPIPPPSE
jgi:hypothetical protein